MFSNALLNTSMAGFLVFCSIFAKAPYKVFWAKPRLPSHIIILIALATNFDPYTGSGRISLLIA
jgi:hypothetical protein